MLPQTEAVKDKGFEILYLTEYVDEFTVKMLHEYEDKEFQNICDEKLDLNSEDEKAALGILRDINKVVVVSYDEADEAKQQAFNARMGKVLDGAEKILEVKDEGETVNIYGTSVNGGESIDDLMIFIPEDCTLVCILGSISAERIADLIEKANE